MSSIDRVLMLLSYKLDRKLGDFMARFCEAGRLQDSDLVHVGGVVFLVLAMVVVSIQGLRLQGELGNSRGLL